MNNAIRFAIPAVLSLAAAASFAQAVQPTAGLSREQVRAEALEARRLGLMELDGEIAKIASPAQAEQIRLAGQRAVAQAQGLPAGEIKAVSAPATGKTRAQVQAEAREALRLGLLTPNADETLKVATPAQAEQIRLAGLRAVGNPTAQN